MRGPLVAALVLALVSVTMPARAWDTTVTFQVPVKLQNLDPQVGKIFMQCTITDGQNWSLSGVSSQMPVPNGSYIGTLPVAVPVPSADLGKAKQWHCIVRLQQVGGGVTTAINNPGHPWTKAAPGSVGDVAGQF